MLDNDVQTLSGGELQRVAIVLALAKPCDIYLIDEPSAYLDSEQRVIAAKVMKRWIMGSKRAAFVVEHDFIMATYMADKVVVFDGIPAKESFCTAPESLVTGMNRFLKLMDITFRRDPTNFRPRINKWQSQKDQEQKAAGNYFLMEETAAKINKKKGKEDDESDEEEVKMPPPIKKNKQAEPASKEGKEEKKTAKKEKAEQKKASTQEETKQAKPAAKGKKSKKKADSDEDDWVDDE